MNLLLGIIQILKKILPHYLRRIETNPWRLKTICSSKCGHPLKKNDKRFFDQEGVLLLQKRQKLNQPNRPINFFLKLKFELKWYYCNRIGHFNTCLLIIPNLVRNFRITEWFILTRIMFWPWRPHSRRDSPTNFFTNMTQNRTDSLFI